MDHEAELSEMLISGCTPERARALFDQLPAVPVTEVTTGRWRGEEIDTGHPWNGVLAESGWYGKQFDDADTVHPLLYTDDTGSIFAVNPRRVPLSIVGGVPRTALRAFRKSLRYTGFSVRTREPKGRLRNVEYRGVISAAMLYDERPMIDHFRRVDASTLLGAMDTRGTPDSYFFVLRK
ncbi:DUF4334 domain-containing protein [Nocardia goodfellowii]